jgi:uncharacterized protein (DUF1330 family)
MKYYFVANIKVLDHNEYQKYLEKADEIFSKFKGKYLAVDNSPMRLEGKWDYSKSVIIEFDSKKDFEEWYFSEEYQQILRFRLDASDCDTVLIEGLKNVS